MYIAARSRPQCRAGVFARRFEACGTAGFPGRCKHCRPQAAFRSAKYEVPALSAEIVPCETQGKALPGFAGHLRRKAAMHPSVCAGRRLHHPLKGGGLGDGRR